MSVFAATVFISLFLFFSFSFLGVVEVFGFGGDVKEVSGEMLVQWCWIWRRKGCGVGGCGEKGLWCYGFGVDGGNGLFWTWIWCWNNLRTGDITGGGWC
jgi:hypothetical protein